MTRMILGMCLLLMASGCVGKHVVRNADTMRANVAFTNQLVSEFQGVTEAMMKRGCSCDANGKWVVTDAQGNVKADDVCNRAAEVVIITRVRWPWHTAMAEYLNGFSEKRPADTPAVPDNSTLCAEMGQ